jgi:hypothetical protein
MRKKETGLQEREKTLVKSQIKKLDEIIAMIRSTKLALNKNVTELSGILREQRLSRQEPSSEEIAKMFIMLDLSLRAAATLKETQELLDVRLTELRNN